MREREIDVVYRLLDDQLVDGRGQRCGRIDDLEFSGDPGGPAQLSAIISGKGVYHRRLPRRLRRLGARLFGSGVLGDDVIRIPWTEVFDVTEVVKLRRPGLELGLSQGEDWARGVVEKIPHSG